MERKIKLTHIRVVLNEIRSSYGTEYIIIKGKNPVWSLGKKERSHLSLSSMDVIRLKHRLSINRPTKRLKENSRSDGHCQCEKEVEDY
jgi:hypothetical protein